MKFIKIAALLGAVTVVMGAFGAHALKPHLSEYQVGIYEKAVQYQFYHILAIGLAAVLMQQGLSKKWLERAAWLFVAGIAFFSGSLYLLACRDLLSFSVGWAGPVTPLGGVCFIGGWLSLFRATLQR